MNIDTEELIIFMFIICITFPYQPDYADASYFPPFLTKIGLIGTLFGSNARFCFKLEGSVFSKCLHLYSIQFCILFISLNFILFTGSYQLNKEQKIK